MTDPKALVIDDEPDICELLKMTLERMDIPTTTVHNFHDGKVRLEREKFNICLTDLKLPDGNGIEMVKHIHENYPDLPTAVISAHGNMDTAIEALKAGAFDFISKPLEIDNLRRIVSSAINISQTPNKANSNKIRIFGQSQAIKNLEKSIIKLSRSQAPVYISGESGSGKELVARAIHENGPRASNPFVPVNCGAIPSELMESEFFGHKKGSFTGALQDKQGLFKAAEGGTLFLDEVADLPIDMQVKLLRAIQEKAIRAVGAAKEDPIDVRILSATHKNLADQVAANKFRQDLFYRLNVIQLDVPALRERTDDIEPLANQILQKLSSEADLPQPTLAPEALKQLNNYSFPGNVRELENILERAFTLCESNIITTNDLQLKADAASTAPNRSPSGSTASYYAQCREFDSLDDYLAEIEKEVLLEMLENVRWNKTLAAKELGITFRSLRYRLQKLGLESE